MANLYYRDSAAANEFTPGALVEIDGEEARHAVRVARLREGESIMVGNGRGTVAHGEVVEAGKDRFVVRLDRVAHAAESPQQLILVQALAKGDRDERAVEQSTEFGIDQIAPWQAERSISRWENAAGADKATKGVAKWARIAREASKQSLRAWIPEILAPMSLAELLARAERPDTSVLVLHPAGSLRLTEWCVSGAARSSSRIYLMIGPEGGFSDHELEALVEAGATAVVLGETVLRTSSAGPAAIAVLNSHLGRW